MWQSEYLYYASIRHLGGEQVADVPLAIDWIPALRWWEFEPIKHKVCTPPATSAVPVIEPVWNEQLAQPYLAGIRIRASDADQPSVDLPLEYLSSAVNRASSRLVTAGTLAAGAKIEYQLFALPQPEQQPEPTAFHITPANEPPPVENGDLDKLLTRAVVTGTTNAGPASTNILERPSPVFFPQSLIDEVSTTGLNAGHIEAGGILVGKLLRDRRGALYTQVTAQIAAPYTEATETSLRFTPKAWSSVNAALQLRASNEIMLGWWHSHPHFCRDCPQQHRQHCRFSEPVFSEADCQLQREVFQKPWNVALLLSFLGEELPHCDLYGWDRGQISPLPLYRLPH